MKTSNFKVRQHLIYITISVILGLLINEGIYSLILIGFVYFKRFPKTYWIYFLISLGTVVYFNGSTISLEDNAIYIKEAKVVSIIKQKDEQQTVKIETEAGRFYLTLASKEPRLTAGDWIMVQAEVEPVDNPTIPHAFNFKDYLLRSGMRGSLYLKSTEIIRHDWSIKQYQSYVSRWIKEQYPPLTATYLQAWFLGIKNDLSDELNDSYSLLGVIHLFAVSGLHVSLLMTIIGYLLKRVGVIEEIGNYVLIIFLIGFILISGASASIIRAGTMTILARFNKQFKWRLSSLDILSIVFLMNFIAQPLQVYQIGFIYSYWLTFCLIACQSLLKQHSRRTNFFILPLIAQLAVLPIQLSQQYYINLMGYVANLILIPVVTIGLIPLLLITLFCPVLAVLTERVLQVFESSILMLSSLLNLPWIIGAISLSHVLLIISLLFFCAWNYEAKRQSKQWCLSLLLIIFLLESIRGVMMSNKVTFLDVGQGDSSVIQSTFHGCTIVIDTGGKILFTGEKKSIYKKTLQPYLLGEGVREIDYLILSHGDFDHMGEAEAVLQNFPVKTLVVPNHSDSELLREVVELAKEADIEIMQPYFGDTITCGNQRLTFLQPNGQQANENDQSLVFLLELNGFSALYTGDISVEIENLLLKTSALKPVDVYKAAHHGSKTSNSMAFLRKLQPTLAVVSVGENNSYGHPSKDFLQVLSELEIPLLSTATNGTVQFQIRNQQVNIYSFK